MAPLLVKSNGSKFGKTEKDTIFLDRNLTTPYAFYQYLVNTEDSEVEMLLKRVSDLAISDIEIIMKKNKDSPREKIAANALAENLLLRLHDEEALNKAKRISEHFFNGDLQKLELSDFENALGSIEKKTVSSTDILVIDLLYSSNFVCSSKTEAKKLVDQKGILINGELIATYEKKLSDFKRLHDKYYLIRKGKKNFFIVEVVNV